MGTKMELETSQAKVTYRRWRRQDGRDDDGFGYGVKFRSGQKVRDKQGEGAKGVVDRRRRTAYSGLAAWGLHLQPSRRRLEAAKRSARGGPYIPGGTNPKQCQSVGAPSSCRSQSQSWLDLRLDLFGICRQG